MNERGFKMREEGYLNDLYYEDRPMWLVVPDPLQKADEQELEQSRKEKSRNDNGNQKKAKGNGAPQSA